MRGLRETVTPSPVSRGVPGGATTLLNDHEAGWTGRVQRLGFLPNRIVSPDRDIVCGMKRVVGDDGFVAVRRVEVLLPPAEQTLPTA
jgi:hypothetical protein